MKLPSVTFNLMSFLDILSVSIWSKYRLSYLDFSNAAGETFFKMSFPIFIVFDNEIFGILAEGNEN